MTSIFDMVDDIGPEKIIHIHNHGAGLRAIVVVDNTATGPAIGGVRMAPDADLDECMRLARAMTLKNAAAGLPHGGGKSVILADPSIPLPQKQKLIRAFAQAIGQIADYIPGPDMGTDERCMAWLRDETGRAVGLPRVLGGIPLDQIGATGHGVAVAADVAQAYGEFAIGGARVAIQGYGAVGRHAAHCLAKKGAVIVAVADSDGVAFIPEGFDLARLDALKASGKPVTEYPGADLAQRDAIITAECDVLVPAARPDVINIANADLIKARLVVEGANIPATVEAEAALHKRGVLVIPDFIANAGGVICAAVEYRGGTETQAMTIISEKIRENTHQVLKSAQDRGIPPRDAARQLVKARLSEAMTYRRAY